VGRHSSPEQSPFVRSLAGWFLPWALVAAVAIVAVWIAVDALQGPLKTSPPASAATRSTPTASAIPSATPSRPARTKAKAHHERARDRHDRDKGSTRAKPKPSPKPSPSPEPIIAEGVTVQVLNGARSPSADDAMAARLARLGFQIVATGSASKSYDETTVFWSYSSARRAAEALADHFGWVSGPRPANLSDLVAIHVVVGNDEA
jgi:hypothetical protein